MHSHPEAADTLIVGAQLYDGTGAPPVERDVAVRDGKVAALLMGIALALLALFIEAIRLFRGWTA